MSKLSNYCNINHFKETRVAIVVDDLTGPINYQTCTDNEFLTKAEEQGNTWTTIGFQKFIDSGAFLEFMHNVEHPNYLMTRFINMYEHDGTVFCNDEGISNPTE
jgi:hypothetical protein